MHTIQKNILKLLDDVDLGSKSLREIGRLVGDESPQKIKHHLSQLEKKGLIKMDRTSGFMERVSRGELEGSDLVVVPVVGSADCGPATIFADENVESHLFISEKLVPRNKDIFALRASGNSMNRADIGGDSIEDGDYVVVDPEEKAPKSGDYVLSIIDGCANIKKFVMNKDKNQIILISESTSDFPPIYIHHDDFDEFLINGKVVRVVKNPKNL